MVFVNYVSSPNFFVTTVLHENVCFDNLRLTKNEEIARQKEKTENEIEYCILVVQGSQHF